MADGDNRMPETEPSPVVKAQFIGSGRDGTEQSNVLETPDEQRTLYEQAQAIEPPLDPLSLAHLFEMSGALRSNIDAYATNIDSFGHRFEPLIDVDARDAVDKVRLAMVQERLLGLDSNGNPTDSVDKVLSLLGKAEDRVDDIGELPEPTDAEVAKRMQSIRREMIRERLAVEKFFSFCTVDGSFEQLRMRTRHDIEAIGFGFWEVLRNADGEIVQFNHVPAHSMRLLPQEATPRAVTMSVRATLITPAEEIVHKRFRRYVQVASTPANGQKRLMWFKEFGDPKVYSSATGNAYDTAEALAKKEPKASPATELVYFRVYNSRSAYGVPRWVSEMLSVVGTRHADEVNASYFENKTIPPMAILVSNGRFDEDDTKRIEDYFKNELKGKKNFHKVMILQAQSPEGAMPGLATGKTTIDIKPLTETQHTDGQFLAYKEKNTDAIGSVFRLPRLLRGDARDFNRATAQTSLDFTEQQVFGPLRTEFDHFVNRVLLPAIGINYWKFCSKGPDFSDPVKLLENVNEAAKANYLTPDELRVLASRGFGTDFEKLEQDWTSRPVQLTLAGISTGQTAPQEASRESTETPVAPGEPTAPRDDELAKEAARLIELNKRFARKQWEADVATWQSDQEPQE